MFLKINSFILRSEVKQSKNDFLKVIFQTYANILYLRKKTPFSAISSILAATLAFIALTYCVLRIALTLFQ